MKRVGIILGISLLSLPSYAQWPGAQAQTAQPNASATDCDGPNQPTCADLAAGKERRRQAFTSGRKLLLDHGVAFEPDELLDKNWKKNLKTALDSMPEMHRVVRETRPLKGVYIADTLYLPEHVSVDDDIFILVNGIVF